MDELIKLFEGIELSEEQVAGLGKYLESYKTKVIKEHQEANKDNGQVDMTKYVLIEDAEKAFDLFEADCDAAFAKYEEEADAAFALFEKHAERAFELFEEDADKAFSKFEEETRETYTENMAKAIQELYGDIEERVKKDFMESKEYKTLKALKELALPLFEAEDHDLVQKVKQLSEEKELALKENKELAKDKTIATLLKDIPAEYAETVRVFISKGIDEDDVIERFNAIIEMMETKISNEESLTFVRKTKPAEKKGVVESKKEEAKKNDKPITEEAKIEEEKQNAEHSFEYESVEVKKEINKTVNAFTEEERKMLESVGIPT
mgnify:CR=1 FL=1